MTSKKNLVNEAEKTVIYEEKNPKGKLYTQTIVVWGTKCEELWAYLDKYNPAVAVVIMPPDGICIIGVGPFFPPFFTDEMEFRCVNWFDDLLRTHHPIEGCDLTHIAQYLRFGGKNGNFA
jgi:hypothetical protein